MSGNIYVWTVILHCVITITYIIIHNNKVCIVLYSFWIQILILDSIQISILLCYFKLTFL